MIVHALGKFGTSLCGMVRFPAAAPIETVSYAVLETKRLESIEQADAAVESISCRHCRAIFANVVKEAQLTRLNAVLRNQGWEGRNKPF